MEHRARIRTQLRRVGITAALAALLVPAAAGTADAAKHKKKTAKLPVITKVSPMRAAISAPHPPVLGASWTMTTRPVFFTDSVIVAISIG